MNKPKKLGKQKKPVKGKAVFEIETEPDAWERFEHAVDAAVKSGPKHRPSKEPKPSPVSVKKSDG